MAVLAHSDAAEIASRLEAMAVPVYENLREPENGLVMVRGRIGGDGAPFNLGEATVSRAAVRLSTGEVGFGYTLGRDRQKARMIALCDALVQSDEFADAVESQVIAPLRTRMISERNRTAAETAATRVDFYTLVRGEG
jgi:alpha-D-ribose 1-methylphosphonate 5-triphosphate synthase subunit PhnG